MCHPNQIKWALLISGAHFYRRCIAETQLTSYSSKGSRLSNLHLSSSGTSPKRKLFISRHTHSSQPWRQRRHIFNLHRRNRDVLNMPRLWVIFLFNWYLGLRYCACSKKWKDTGSVLCIGCVLTLSRKRCLCAAVSGYCRSACRVELSFWKCSCMIWPKGSCGWICSYITKRDCGRSFAAQPMMASDLKDTTSNGFKCDLLWS